MTTLLAANPFLESVHRSLNEDVDSTELAVFGISILCFLLVLLVAARLFNQEKTAGREPEVDYLTVLVDLLGLSEEDRRDLRRVAAGAGLAQPAAILLTPANFAHAIGHPGLGRPDPAFVRRMDDLSRRLFGTPLVQP
jgi:hypothetical protein